MNRNTLYTIICSAFLGLSFSCKGGGADLQAKAQQEACAEGCDKARAECEEKCAEETDAEACKVACGAAKDKCVSECNEQK